MVQRAGDGEPRLYADLADWWPLLSRPEEYAEEATAYADALEQTCDGTITWLLELGSGGGNNAFHLKQRFDRLVLTDISRGMLDVSRRLNPDCEHHLGDMRTLRLGRTFDAVFVHDAVCYMTTEPDLLETMETAWVHCRAGGAALFAPDYVRETFRPGSDEGGHDEVLPEGIDGCPRGLRFLEWVWDPDPSDGQYVADYAYLLREADGSVSVVHDRHQEGLYPRDRWLALMTQVGFVPRRVLVTHSDWEPGVTEVFVGQRPR